MGLGVYVHIPFCMAKCSYCDFYSQTPQKYDDFTQWQDEHGTYLKNLCNETMLYQDIYAAQVIETLYLGGGTPTCLTGGQLSFLLQFFAHVFQLTKDAEITVEGNPGTLNENKLFELKEAGCNRLSLGVQSFKEKELKLIGRIHNSYDVYNTYKLARQTGYNNISLDLMYGLPGQRLADWQYNLNKALELNPDHISLYQLNIEEGTLFYNMMLQGHIQEFEQELALNMYEYAIETLTRAGFIHYEISNFAKPDKKSRHNQRYWRYEEYLGLGAGASGFLGCKRYTNVMDLAVYNNLIADGKKPVSEEETIDEELAKREAVFLGFRLLDGINKENFRKRFNVQIEDIFQEKINDLKKDKLIDENNSNLFLTRKGLYLANQVFMAFL